MTIRKQGRVASMQWFGPVKRNEHRYFFSLVGIAPEVGHRLRDLAPVRHHPAEVVPGDEVGVEALLGDRVPVAGHHREAVAERGGRSSRFLLDPCEVGIRFHRSQHRGITPHRR